jgi:hypothetical protein
VFVMYVKPILSGWGSADIGEIHSVNWVRNVSRRWIGGVTRGRARAKQVGAPGSSPHPAK